MLILGHFNYSSSVILLHESRLKKLSELIELRIEKKRRGSTLSHSGSFSHSIFAKT